MEKHNVPKGIIIAHNPLSRMSGNGKTIAAMFSKWDKEALAQIYITPQQPDFQICSNFYQITDKETVKSFFQCSKTVGHKVNEAEFVGGCSPSGKRRRSISSSSLIGWYGRNFFWNRKKWLNEDFVKWVDYQRPDFVFLAAGNLEATFEMAEFITERKKIPLIVHIGDDYYSKSKRDIFLAERQRKHLSERLRKAIAKSQLVIAISDKMADKFKKLYGGSYITCMNCIDLSERYQPVSLWEEEKKQYRMAYIGNLSVNRWSMLPLMDEALKKAAPLSVILEIYSNINDEKLLEKISKLQNVKYCGTVYGDKLHNVREQADILLILESFDKSVKRILETAMSTKVPECLYAGRPILAVGPIYSGTIGYLYENELAKVVAEEKVDKIAKALKDMIKNKEETFRRIQRGKETAVNKFSLEENSKAIFKSLTDICSKGCVGKK